MACLASAVYAYPRDSIFDSNCGHKDYSSPLKYLINNKTRSIKLAWAAWGCSSDHLSETLSE